MKVRKKAVLCAILAGIMLSTATPSLKLTVFADSAITETEALDKAVALYEHLTDKEVEIPQGLDETGLDTNLIKPIVLGYINFEDTEEAKQEKSITKQDFMTILYKTIITYNDSYTIYEDEANSILNECYDNAYVNDENRIAYAFMMKQGIITAKFGTEPNKELTKEECETLIDTVYDYFAQNVMVTVGGKEIRVGANISTILDTFGEPNRIDQTEYGFEWYVYDSNYSEFCMVGVEADRVCALYTNSSSFDFNGMKSGDDYSKTADYLDNRCYRFYVDSEGHLDSILYNPRYRGVDDSTSVKRSKSMILLDMINSYRSKHNKTVYVEDSDMNAAAWLSSLDFMNEKGYESDVVTQSGYDVFSVYRQLLESDNDILVQDTQYTSPIGLNTTTDLSGGIQAKIAADTTSIAVPEEKTTVEIPQKDYSITPVEEVTTPILNSPVTEDNYEEGDDVVIELAMQAATEYHIDGFRFDLMGVHDLDTMKAVRKALDQVSPDIMVYGEGWTGGESALPAAQQATKNNIYRLDRVGAFSDDIRDGIKGSVFDFLDKGFVSGKDDMEENIKFSVVAATPHSQVTLTKAGDKCTNWSGQPGQSINYISCHDNLTFWDKLAISNADDSEADRVKMNKLGSAVLFTSQGVPFMQAGEEMLRSKPNEKSETGFDENSYSSPDATNSIKWDNKGNVMDVYEYYKGLIAFRKAHSALRMTTAAAIQNNLTFMTGLDANVVAYTIQGEVQGETAQNIAVIYNGNPDAVTVNLPAGTWDICVNGKKAGCRSLGTAEGSVTVEGISALVLVQEDDTVNKVPAEDA